MITAFILLIVALLLIYAEFFLPGGVMGMTGAIAMLTAIALFAQSSPSLIHVLLFVVLSLAGVIGVVRLAMRQIQHSKSDQGGIYLSKDQEGFKVSGHDESMIGMRGVAVTEMKPAGHIRVEDKRLQAVSRTGFIAKDTEVEVIAGEGAHLIVKPLKKETP